MTATADRDNAAGGRVVDPAAVPGRIRPGPAPWSMTYKASVSRESRAMDRPENLPAWPRKETVPCCLATRDDLGRLCIGLCGPECRRRPAPALTG